jgi:hypothetical protein
MLKEDETRASNIVKQIITIGESNGKTSEERLEFYLTIMELLEIEVKAIHTPIPFGFK